MKVVRQCSDNADSSLSEDGMIEDAVRFVEIPISILWFLAPGRQNVPLKFTIGNFFFIGKRPVEQCPWTTTFFQVDYRRNSTAKLLAD